MTATVPAGGMTGGVADNALAAVGGFVFLRLFSAALQGPHVYPFALVPDVPDKTFVALKLLCDVELLTRREFDCCAARGERLRSAAKHCKPLRI